MTPTGPTLRDQGQDAVLAADTAVHRGFAEHVHDAVDQLIAAGQVFDAEDIRALVPEGVEPHSPNLLPAILGSLAARDRIRAVGHRRCTRPSRRAGWMRIWAAT